MSRHQKQATPLDGQDDPADRRRADAAERMRRYRERQRAGTLVVAVEVDDELIDELIERGELGMWDADNREALSEVIRELLQRLL